MSSVIQGLADVDVGGKLTQERVAKTIAFCLNAFGDVTPQAREHVLGKLDRVKRDPTKETAEDMDKLSADELRVLHTIRARQLMRTEDLMHIRHFEEDAIEGLAPRLERGMLGLVAKAGPTSLPAYTDSLFDVIMTSGQQRDQVLPEV